MKDHSTPILGVQHRSATPKEKVIDINERLRLHLGDLAEALALRPLPALSSRHRLVFRDDESFYLYIGGNLAGLWSDERAEAGSRDLVEFIAYVRDKGLDDARRYAENFLRGRRDELARYLWSISKPIAGTPAEAYIRSRGLKTSALPLSLRYLEPHKDFPGSLVGAVTDEAGTVHALQRICLTPEGTPVFGEDGKKLKPQLGPVSSGVVRFPGDGELVIVEGIETGLAVNQLGYEVHCVLSASNFDRHLRSLPKDKHVIIGRDFAHEGEAADLVMRKVFFALAQDGYSVRMADPLDGLAASNAAIPKGLDFLDLLVLEGAGAVEKAIQAAEEVAPHFKSDPMSAEDISFQIYDEVRDFVSFEEKDGEQIKIGYAAPAGIGKTELVLKALAEKGAGKFVEYLVPTHDLATEIEERLRKKNKSLPIFHIHGRDKEHCQKNELAEEMANAGLSPQSFLCRKEEKDDKTGEVISASYCPHYWECGYQRQFIGSNQKKTPGVRLRATEAIHHPRHPEAPKPQKVIIDERLPSLVRKTSLPIALLADPGGIPGRHDLDDEQREAIDRVCSVFLEAILKDAPLRKYLEDAGVTAEDLTLAVSAIGTEAEPAIMPHHTTHEQRTALGSFKRKGFGRMARCFRLMKEEMEALPSRDTFGRVYTYYSRNGEKLVGMRYSPTLYVPKDASVLWIDADLDPVIAEKIVPGISVRTFQAERKGVHVTQVSDRTFSKTSLLSKDEKLLSEAQDFISRTATPGTLIVATKKILDLLKVPKGCRSVHWGKHRGRDDLKDCHTAIIIGREEYPASEYEKIASALFWQDPEPISPLKKERTLSESLRTYRMRDGSVRTAKVNVYPHIKGQVLVELGRERETLQAIDRLRLVRNDTPKQVYILCNIPLDIEVDELMTWRELTGSTLLNDFLEENGVVPTSRREIARAVGMTEREARTELSYFSPPDDAVRVQYRKYGQRGSPSEAIAMPSATEEDIQRSLSAVQIEMFPQDEKEEQMQVACPVADDVWHEEKRLNIVPGLAVTVSGTPHPTGGKMEEVIVFDPGVIAGPLRSQLE